MLNWRQPASKPAGWTDRETVSSAKWLRIGLLIIGDQISRANRTSSSSA
jgi:hypothetical protein